MMIDWGGLLARKYDIMQQNADAETIRAKSLSNLENVRAGLLPAESQANNALTAAQRGMALANTESIAENTKFIAPRAKAEIGYLGAQTGEANARRGMIGAETEGVNQLNKFFGGFRFSDDTSLNGGTGGGLRRWRPLSDF